METAVEILQFVAITAMALTAGGQIFCTRALVQALPAFATEVSVQVHQESMTWRPDSYLKRIGAVGMIVPFVIVALVLIDGDVDVIPMILTLLAGLLGAFQAYVTVHFEWPINNEVNSWGSGPVPDRYPEMRKEWDSKHIVRTVASTLALACLTAAAILY